MQMQTAQTGRDDAELKGLNPELPAIPQTEKLPLKAEEDISSTKADERAIAEATVNEVQSAEGKVFKTLRVAPETLPTEQSAEEDPAVRIKKEVEQIMQQGLVEYNKNTKELSGLFTELPPDRQELLKKEGERLAVEFTEMILSGKFDPKMLHMDLKQWLRIIPDVTQPWAEQEATIKKDKISNLFNQVSHDPNMLN
jgi:hypothetical protein